MFKEIRFMNFLLSAFCFVLATASNGDDFTLEYSSSTLGTNMFGVGIDVIDHKNGYGYSEPDFQQKIVIGDQSGTVSILEYTNNNYQVQHSWRHSSANVYGICLADVDYSDWNKSVDIITGNTYGWMDISYYDIGTDELYLEGLFATNGFENPMTVGAAGADLYGIAAGYIADLLLTRQIAIGDTDGLVHFFTMDLPENGYDRETDPDKITYYEFCSPVDVGSSVSAVSKGDVTGDALEDVVVGHQDGVSILEYNPAGTNFVEIWNSDDAGVMTNESVFRGLAVGDTDQDGYNEIVCGTYHGKVYVIDYADSSATVQLIQDVGYKAYGILIADIDGGSRNEIVVTGSASSSGANSTLYAFEYNGTNYVQEYTATGAGNQAGFFNALAAGDPDGDGQTEIIIGAANQFSVLQATDYAAANVDYPLAPDSGLCVEWRSNSILPTDDPIKGLSVEDVNNDGIPEIILGNQMGWLRTLAHNGTTHGYDIEWERRVLFHVYGVTSGMVGATPGDPSQICFAGSNQKLNTWAYDTNATDCTLIYTNVYQTQMNDPSTNATDWSYGIAVGDVNYRYGTAGSATPWWGKEVVIGGADGKLYIFVYNSTSNQFFVQPPVDLNDQSIHGLAIGDVNNDGENEIIAGGQNLYIVKYDDNDKEYDIVWTNQAAGILTNESLFYGIAIGDVDHDGDNEIVVSDYKGIVSVLDHTGSNTYTATTVQDIGYRGYGIAIGELDGNSGNGDEFAVCGTNNDGSTSTAYLFRYDGTNYVRLAKSAEYLGSYAGSFGTVGIGDVDDDGTNEIVTGTDFISVLQYYPPE